MGDNKTIAVTGKGKVNITTKQGDHKFILDVYFVPELKHILMSVDQLVQKGSRLYFETMLVEFLINIEDWLLKFL